MFRNFALILLAACLTALAVDLSAFYLLGWRRPSSQPHRFFRPDPLFGHYHRPNVADHWYHGGGSWWVETNGFGMADGDRELRKKRPRIALLGDSTTEFWEAPPELRPQVLLERKLKKFDSDFEVLNFGVRGYGTDQSFLLLRRLALKFAPDIVIYTFCINDIFDNTRTENLQHTLGKPKFVLQDEAPDGLQLVNYPAKAPSAKPGMSYFLEEYSFLYRGLADYLWRESPWDEVLRIESNLLPNENVLHPELRPYLRRYEQVDQERLSLVLRLIAAMHRVSASSGAKFLLVEGLHLYPLNKSLREELVTKYGDVFDFRRVSRDLEAFAANTSISFLSLPEVARERDVNVAAIMHDDIHLNGRGARFFSRVVARELRRLGWASSDIEPTG